MSSRPIRVDGASAVSTPAPRQPVADPQAGGPHGLPNVGEVIKRLRLQHGLSLRELASASSLSTSFLSSVERGESDIAVGRLARVAECLGHDIGSLLGYSSRRARPHFIGAESRVSIERGAGIDYRVLRLTPMGLELILMYFAPHSAFTEEISHEGVDAVHVVEGQVVLTLDQVDYTLVEGECVIFSAAYLHGIRNDCDAAAFIISITDSQLY